ncbi:MAG: ribosome maturation factor RimM [Gammaproteobacteria bacterium]
MEQRKPLLVGKISGLFGTRGWVKLFSYTRPHANLINYPKILVGEEYAEHRFSDCKQHGNKLLAQLSDVDDRGAAANLVGSNLYIARNWLSAADDGTYYWADLIGLRVVNLEGNELGTVTNMLETGANDVLQLSGDQPRLIPFVVDTFIKTVDLETGVIEVDWHADD